ncbi:hypothetical protein PC121_g3773 [Phytophthora cactorum]|uniref:Uncharacterized protein n=1 Tax=Phytophthora cactorum TaxID=29920 RepID=A0A8T1EA09_9STRA|nr:hypothetical protein PC117_g6259 [Phytophthora cactorum]KAG3091588.1 hypothetical protein PC121_g3773 [Phytophthora cactorum]
MNTTAVHVPIRIVTPNYDQSGQSRRASNSGSRAPLAGFVEPSSTGDAGCGAVISPSSAPVEGGAFRAREKARAGRTQPPLLSPFERKVFLKIASFERGASAVKGPTKPPRAAGTNDGSNTLSSSADRPRPPLSALFSSLSFGSAVNWGRERSLTRRNPPAL